MIQPSKVQEKLPEPTVAISSYYKIHEWQTRLALIKPDEDLSACLELSLVVVDLVDLDTGAIINHDTLVKYDALSYAWGNATPSAKCICDGNAILLRDNLDSALRYLRKPQDVRYVWIDFLCINQNDLVEKAFQIPRMKTIFSKASTVVVWLGKSLPVANITRRCSEECGLDEVYLSCPDHGNELWKSILDYAWFRRTWVRQEVFAAKKLDVCCPYFSATWESFNVALRSVDYIGTPESASSHEALRNLNSLNELYSSRRLELLDLLKQGKGFQASVPHDHIFSVLGMMSTPKHSATEPIPVTYDKTYHEVCGDATRYIIRDSKSISILRWCPSQKDKSYAFDWPAIEVSCPISGEMEPEIRIDEANMFLEQFDIDNPIRKASAPMMLENMYHRNSGALRPSENLFPSSASSQFSIARPLLLYGKPWGKIVQFNTLTTYTGEQEAHVYLAEHYSDTNLRMERSFQDDADEYHEFFLYKLGLVRRIEEGKPVEYEMKATWRCHGTAREGDVFVSLEPDLWNFVLRKCSKSGDLFEVVAWGGEMFTNLVGSNMPVPVPVKDTSAYYLGEVEEEKRTWISGSWRPNDAPGPRQRFEIR
ncbi:unnamed protein product [Alternaria burnsii]|nr:unnamed protein product [Alternaria burnsii]